MKQIADVSDNLSNIPWPILRFNPVVITKQILEIFPNSIILDAFGQTEITPVTSFRLEADPQKLEDKSCCIYYSPIAYNIHHFNID